MAIFLAILLYASPGLAVNYYPSETLNNFLSYVVVMVSPLMLFYLMRIREQYPNGNAASLFKVWLLMAFIIPIFLFGSYGIQQLMSIAPQIQTPGADIKTGFAGQLTSMWDTSKKVVDKWVGSAQQSLNPGQYYRGTVEQNKDAKKALGVTIDYFKPQDLKVANDSEIVIMGGVTAKTFIGTVVPITPSCTISSVKAAQARVEPTQIDVINGISKSYQCTFPPQKSGTYTVKGSATFPFETWAYIPYTFVDEERALNIARQGKSIVDVLKLGSAPIATYTTGPVTVGMEGSDHPMIVNPLKTPMMKGRIGLTIDNGWTTGSSIKQVTRIELKVPNPFTINCSGSRALTEEPKQDPNEPDYTDYVFENKNFTGGNTYQSITCKLDVMKGKEDEARLLLSQGDSVTRTFIAVIDYDYTIEKSTTVQVR